MEDFEPTLQKQTQFFSTSKPEPIMTDLMALLKSGVVEAEGLSMSSSKWKLKFVLKDARSGPIQCNASLLRVDDSMLCVEFARKSGDQMVFLEKFKAIKTALNVYNDATFE